METISRRIRSYVCRGGNTTKGQRQAFLQYADKWVIPYNPHQLLDFTQVFSRSAPITLEIGFGSGDATAQIAQNNPHHDYLGIEVYPSGVGRLLMRIEEKNIGNIRIIQHDVVEVLQHMIGNRSLDAVHVFFPDPWPKKRHHKRRLLQPNLLRQLAKKLKPGGYFYFVSDWEEYAQQVLETCERESLLENAYEGYAPAQSWRPKTRFQQKGEEARRGIFEIYFNRV